MIQQVLNKRLLQDLLASIQPEIELAIERRTSGEEPTPLDDFSTAQNEELLQDVKNARIAVADASDASAEGGRSEASDGTIPGSEFKTYIPASPELSNLQSAIEAYFLEQRSDLIQDTTAPERRGFMDEAGARLTIWDEYLEDRRLLGEFEQTDIRWISAKMAEGMRHFRGRHPFVARPVRAQPIPLSNQSRILIVGDWGSGIPRAQKVADQMRVELDKGLAEGLQQHVIHLGDVYYAGWEYEYRDRFLRYWPVRQTEADQIGSFTLNGNHDMYSGGNAYYEVALKDPRFLNWQGQSSLFALANDFWQLFGLDTSYEDKGLEGDQSDWVLGTAFTNPRKDTAKTILLSHHQYCTAHEEVSDKLINKIFNVLRLLDVRAWLWGHEHRCVTYKDVPAVAFPRCFGHGGVPVYQLHRPESKVPPPGDYEYREVVFGGVLGIEPWAKLGFVALDFQNKRIQARYINEDGLEHHREQIE